MGITKNGWVYLHKSILEWEWYDDINTFRLFIHLLLKANYTATKWHGIEIKRGQLPTGRFSLAKETGLSEQQVRTSLTKLKSTSEITNKTTNRYTIITIVNYDKYQSICKTSTSESTSQPTNEQPTDNHSLIKRIKIKNKNSSLKVLREPELWEELSLKFNTNRSFIEKECEKMEDWLKSKGKTQKDYKAFARNWIRRATEKTEVPKESPKFNILNTPNGK